MNHIYIYFLIVLSPSKGFDLQGEWVLVNCEYPDYKFQDWMELHPKDENVNSNVLITFYKDGKVLIQNKETIVENTDSNYALGSGVTVFSLDWKLEENYLSFYNGQELYMRYKLVKDGDKIIMVL